MRKYHAHILLLIFFFSFLSSCKRPPPYETPEIDIPCEWHSQTTEEMDDEATDSFIWWESLNDPLLSSLIESAASQNLDLNIALARVLESRTEQKGAHAQVLPHIDGSLTYGHAQYNQKTLNKILGTDCSSHHGTRNVDLFIAGFDAEWEIDLFGKSKYEARALCAKTESIENEYQHLWVTISAEIARNYIELRGLQRRLEVVDNHIASQQDTLELTEGLVTAGFAGSTDKIQIEAQLNALKAQKPLIELGITKAIHRLSVLLGYSPGELFCELTTLAPLPCLPCKMPIGIPSELLRRRPDVRKAERELAAASERIGSAVAELFPRFSLYGFVGDIAALCSGNGLAWFGGPQLLLPIFNSKMIENDIELSKIKTQQALLAYQKTVLEALEEAENAIASFRAELERNRSLQQAMQASKSNYELTMQFYQKGIKSFLEAQIANRIYLDAEAAYLQSQVDLLLHYIALYKALGGPPC